MSNHYDPTDPHAIAALYACAEASPSTSQHWLDKLAAAYVAAKCPNAIAASRVMTSGRAYPMYVARRAVRAS